MENQENEQVMEQTPVEETAAPESAPAAPESAPAAPESAPAAPESASAAPESAPAASESAPAATEAREARDSKPPLRGKRRKKVCIFCADKIKHIDYKDIPRLRKNLSERAKILPRRVTGTCAMHQRQLTLAIKNARIVALLPYITD